MSQDEGTPARAGNLGGRSTRGMDLSALLPRGFGGNARPPSQTPKACVKDSASSEKNGAATGSGRSRVREVAPASSLVVRRILRPVKESGSFTKRTTGRIH